MRPREGKTSPEMTQQGKDPGGARSSVLVLLIPFGLCYLLRSASSLSFCTGVPEAVHLQETTSHEAI